MALVQKVNHNMDSLGFSMKGLEGAIVLFFPNLRSKKERIHSKETMERTTSKRELKRLEFSINYEKGTCSNGKIKRTRGGKSCFLMIVKLISWNVRGINDNSKSKVVKALLRS